MTAPLEVVSLFDGISGFPEAFGRVGIRTRAIVEIDKSAAGVAAAHFPDAAHFADVTKVTVDDLLALGINPSRTVFCAGWPCTDLSLAGLRLGLGGARSGLVGEVFRLLLGVRPGWFVLENVPGLLSSVCPCPGGGACGPACTAAHTVRGGSCGRRVRGGRFTGPGRCMELHGGGMGTVLRRLVECGYGVAYRVLDAQHFGVPQRRRRVVIVGRLGDAAGPAEVLLEPRGGLRDSAPGRAARARVKSGTVVSALQGGGKNGKRGYRVDAEAAAGGQLLTAGGSGGADDNTAQGGNLITATVTAKWAKGTGGPSGDETQNLVTAGTPVRALRGQGMRDLTAEGADASEDGTGRGTPIIPVDLAQVTSGQNRSNPKDGDPAGTLPPTSRPAIAFNETAGGSSVHEEMAPSIKTGTGGAATAAATQAGVRRLTPVECERLQGYPDEWTLKRAELVQAGNRWEQTGTVLEQADAPRYRQLGNSIAVPVFAWVASGIVMVEEGVADIGTPYDPVS